MSTEINIRLPDAVIEFVDAEVRAGHSPCRSAFILRALEREYHRCIVGRQQETNDDAQAGSFVGYRSLLWSASATPPGIAPVP